MAKSEHLSSTQKKVKHPRRCVYSGDQKNTEPELARDILSLYITCQLGYSAIRHIVGLPTDRKIEDVVRQHMVGRKGVDGTIGELSCPGSTEISEVYKSVIEDAIRRYHTQGDEYNARMMATGKWSDDPIVKEPTTCKNCGKDIQADWKLCPYCGTQLKIGQQRKLL